MDDINRGRTIGLHESSAIRELLKLRELSQVQVGSLPERLGCLSFPFTLSYNPSFQGNDQLYWIPSAIMGLSLTMPIYDGRFFRCTSRNVQKLIR
jgi:hypothetical protein